MYQFHALSLLTHCAFFVLLLTLTPAVSLKIVCGAYHNCVFERGQTSMKCWGRNGDGQLGLGNINGRGDDANEMGSNLPLVRSGSNFAVKDMRLGGYHSCAMSDDTAMKCFGRNRESQLGFDEVTTTGDALPFLEFGVEFNLSKIAAGAYHTCALSTDAALKCFGNNWYGQCGAGTSSSPISGPPSQINAIDLGTNFTPVDVQSSNQHVCVLSQQQTVKCFGDNYAGKLGYGDTTDHGDTPESMGDGLPIVDIGSNFIVAAIATGAHHSCALSTTNTVKCWGWNLHGQCGTPHSTETGDNLPVLDFGADFVPMQLALGYAHTCILAETATLICFGANSYGQLGIGSNTSVDTPSALTGIDLGSNFVPRQVAAGERHTCAVSTDDDVKCWGDNQYGQLGLGDTNDRGDDPNEMGDNLPFVDVAWPAPAASPTTLDPTTASPTTATLATKQPTASPTTLPTTTEPTARPTNATTTIPSFSPSASPTTASPTTERINELVTADPTTPQPSTRSPTTAPTATSSTTACNNNNTVTVTIRTDSLSSTQILIAITNAYNLSSTPFTITTLSSNDAGDNADGFATVELLVAVPSDVELDYDVIEATLREAMVDEYGPDIEVEITEGDAPTQEQPEHPLQWLVPVAYCVVSVCCCFSVFGIVKCTLAKRRQHGNDEHDQVQAAQIELPERRQPPAAVANAYGVHSESEAEEKKEDPDVNPGAGGEPDEGSVSNEDQDEGRRASVAAQTAAVTAVMAEDEFEVVGDDDDGNPMTAGHTRNE